MTRELVVDRSESQLELTPPPAKEPSIGSILARAVEQNMPVESLERIVGLYERMQANAARVAFNAAMVDFKRSCPPVPRRSKNPQFKKVNRDGATVAATFASLDDIEQTVRPHLSANGLSYRWGDSAVADGTLTMRCIVFHQGGHSESASVTLPLDSNAGASMQQKAAIVETYARRLSLVKVLGLTDTDDIDGNTPDAKAHADTISERDLANMDAMIAGDGVDRAAFLKFFGIDKLADMPASRVASAFKLLEDRRRKAK